MNKRKLRILEHLNQVESQA